MKRILAMLAMVWTMHAYAQNTPPVFKNFRIEHTQPGRVYFESNVPVNGSSLAGFVISGKKVSGISIEAGSTSGHYLTVAVPFTYWDNNMIRYEGGSNIASDRGVVLPEFTLQYIENNIPEPNGTGKVYYVSTSGSDVQDGLSESKAWRTITYAANVAKAGDVVYVRAGDYGSEQVVVKNSGTAAEPIKFIGYKGRPGDSPKLERTPSTKFSANEMPYIQSKELTGSGLSAVMKEHIIIRNFQVEGYDETVNIREAMYTVLDNIYVRGGRVNINDFPRYRSLQNRVINSYTSNASKNGVFLTGERHLIDNVYASSYGKPDMDYYIVIVGGSLGLGEHIIRNCTVVRDPSDTHPGHGISLKAQSRPIEYSLVEKSTVTDVGMALEARHSIIKNNVYRDILVSKKGQLVKSLTGIQITSAQKNIFERIHINGYTFGIKFLGSKEDIGALDAGNSNVIRNCLFTNNDINISILEDLNGKNRVPKNNTIINCTFNNSSSMYSVEANESGTGNTITNTIIGNVKSEFGSNKNPHNFQYTYSNFFSDISNQWSSKAQSGLGNISVNPKYENVSSGNFRLKPDSPAIDKGKDMDDVKGDFDGNSRPQGKSIDIGAFEHQDKNTSVIKADAGEDQVICAGTSVVLSAAGGSSYKWSTGATTKSITVSPSATTTYGVTVTDGTGSDTDEVLVTVNEPPKAAAGSDVTIEAGQNTTLTASGGDSYLWNNGATTTSIIVNPSATTAYEVTVAKGGCSATDTVIVTVNGGSQPVGTVKADAGGDQVICTGSSATLTASGGTIYKWSTGATTKSITVSPAATTIYSVTVSDGTNSDTTEVLVTVNETPKASAGADVSIEAGQSTTLTASGGDTYLWSNGATTASIAVNPSGTTEYEVTVTKGTCSANDKVIITVNGGSAPAVTVKADAGKDKSICIGNSTTLIASGGTAFKWSTGATTKEIIVSPSSTTIYSVTVSDGTSSDTDEVMVAVSEIPVADAGTHQTVERGQPVKLTARGGNNYLWSTGETTQSITVRPGRSTIYSVTVSKNGCNSSDSVQVIVNDPPAIANAGNDLTICLGESISINGSGGAAYSWSSGETSQNITVSPTRTTSYTLTAKRGGTTSTDEVIVTVINCGLGNGVSTETTGNSDTADNINTDTSEQNNEQLVNKEQIELTVYPNPTEGNINVQTNIPLYNFNLVLMNINGHVIYSDEMDASEDGISKQIDLSRFAKGVYLLQLYNDEESYVKKVMVI